MRRVKRYLLIFGLFVAIYLTINILGVCFYLMGLPSNIAFGCGILGIIGLVVGWTEGLFYLHHKLVKHIKEKHEV